MTLALSRFWKYLDPHLKGLIDPRLVITKHIEWNLPMGKDSTWNGVEPDNYNLAVFGKQALDCPFVDNQVFFYNARFNGWFSMCCEQDKQLIADYIAWAKRQIIIAYWHYPKAQKVRTTKKLLEDYRKSQTPILTVNERLFQLNYYDKLKYKCDNEFIVERRIGKPRQVALESQQEVESQYDLED